MGNFYSIELIKGWQTKEQKPGVFIAGALIF